MVGRRRLAVAAASWLLAAGCSVSEQQAPSGFIGPSEFGLALTLTADRDSLPRDGGSQTGVTVSTTDSTGKGVAQRIRLSLVGGSAPGAQLSTTEMVTNGEGKGSFTVTAPPSTSAGDSVVVSAVPISGDALNAARRIMEIRVTPSNPNAPVASFNYTPDAPVAGDVVTFDASSSTDEGARCGGACTYAWDFGDGGTATGRVATHAFSGSGNKLVTLTVTDLNGLGASGTASRTVAVAASAPPTAAITVSPTGSRPAGTVLNFDGSGSAAVAVGATIVEYTWTWGDGTAASSGAQTTHTYSAAGTYVVRLTVRDSLGRTGTVTVSVTVT